MVTRREQLGTDDAALAEAKKPTPPKDAPKTRSRQKKQDAPTAPKAKASSSKSGGVEKKEKPKRKSKTENVKESEPEKVKEPENAKESEPETPKEAEPEIPKKVDGKRKKVESQGGMEKKLKTAPAAKAASKRKAEKGDEGTTTRKGNAEGDGQTKTWAGRWIPTDPVALMKFESIKTVFYEKIAPKVKAPSSLQNAFFKLVNNAFKSLAPEAKKKDYLACARKNVEKFLADESVCT